MPDLGVIAALVAGLLVLVGVYALTMRAATTSGRHRLTPDHPGWETALDDLHALQRVRGSG